MGEPIQIGPVQADPRKRALKIAGIAILLILALRVLPGMLFGGGGDTPDEDASVTLTPPGLVPPVVPGGAPETALTFSDKNPFEPLAKISIDSGASPVTSDPMPIIDTPIVIDPLVPDDGDTTVGGGMDPGPTDPGTSSPGASDPGSTPTTQGPPPRQPDRVAMLEIFTGQDGSPQARLRVNDTVHEVREGADFAVSYRLLDVDVASRCAQLLFGDDRFQLCEGDETLK